MNQTWQQKKSKKTINPSIIHRIMGIKYQPNRTNAPPKSLLIFRVQKRFCIWNRSQFLKLTTDKKQTRQKTPSDGNAQFNKHTNARIQLNK